MDRIVRTDYQTDYDLSLQMFTTMRAVDPFRTDEVDTYSNILYTMKKQADLSQLAQHFMTVNKDRPEVSLVIGELWICASVNTISCGSRLFSRELLFASE
jgi:hypothetical protein